MEILEVMQYFQNKDKEENDLTAEEFLEKAKKIITKPS